MSAPPLRRDRRRWRYRLTHRRWWGYGRRSGLRHEHIDHQPASQERQNEHSHGKPGAAGLLLCRAGHGSRACARRLALAGIRPAIKARAGDGGRRVRSASGILAHAEATNADGSPNAGLGQVQPERSKFDALTKSPCHNPTFYRLLFPLEFLSVRPAFYLSLLESGVGYFL
jgi:rhodanese-related sulfurtransferase